MPLRGFILAMIAMGALALAWAETFAPIDTSEFGFRYAPRGSGAAVIFVMPGSGAERAGIRPGDVIDISRLSLSDRYRLRVGISPPGTTVDVSIHRGAERRQVTVRAGVLEHPINAYSTAVFLVSASVSLIVFAAIAWRRPSLATAALVYAGTGNLTTGNVCGLFSALPDPLYGFVCVAITALFASTPALALLPFVVRFPRAPIGRAGRIRMHVADAIFFAGFALYAYQASMEPILFGSWNVFDTWSQWVVAALTLAFAASVYVDAAGEGRRRIGWVITGLVVSDAGYTLFNLLVVDGPINSGPTSFLMASLLGLGQLAQCALPLALAYAILRHRVIDTGFVLNRTAVYAATTTLVLAMVGFVDWLVGRFLSEQRYAVAVEALVTIAFGFALNSLHARTERLVDRLIFRRRHLAEKRIEYRIAALAFAESSASVDDALVHDAADTLALSSAALFARASTAQPFRRAAARGWQPENAVEIETDSLLVRSLRSLERPIFLDDVAISSARFPEGALRPSLAIPLVAQHDLLGVVLYGSHSDGASLDPEEVSLLARLTSAAATAYGAVEARQWRERAAQLEDTLRSLAPL
jgi:hypothetical protein